MAIEIQGYANRPVKDGIDSPAGIGGMANRVRAEADKGGVGDQVSLTASAALLKDLEKEIAQLPVVDTRRVENVQRAIATGTFQVDPPRIADKLLQLELVMNGKG